MNFSSVIEACRQCLEQQRANKNKKELSCDDNCEKKERIKEWLRMGRLKTVTTVNFGGTEITRKKA
ncbi:MAG: hypothetical protein HQK79_22285 [Desulfobacterales bacterium]|nr:hypothetical protein [Desulfobacterales bacterium]